MIAPKTYIARALLVSVALFAGVAAGFAASPATDALRTGKLANGLTYYVRHTTVQPGVAGFYLVQNVGSLMEEEDQRGLAHFLEHMAFNASKNFPGQIDRFFLRNNLTGYNAYTAQDETVYNVDGVPTENAVLVDSCLLVLHDWCHFLTLPEKGIEKERGIILEEWRTRRDAVARAREKIVEKLYNGSRYATREAIGDLKVLETFQRDQLASYYDRWYRPDLQAVIVVGDIDTEAVERFICKHFGDIPAVKKPQPRPIYTVPNNPPPSYVKVVEPELTRAGMEFTQRFAKPAAAASAEELIRRITIRQLFNKMLGARLAQLTTGSDQTLYGAEIAYDELLRGYDALTMSILPYPGRDFRALYRVLEVWETARKLGFTPHEFEMQRQQMLRQAEGFEQNLDRVGYEVYATLYRNHYLNSTPIVEPAQRGALMRDVLETLRVEEVNGWMKGWSSTDDNRIFIVSGNDPQYDYLALEDILNAESDVREGDLRQPTFAVDTARLIDFALKPAKIQKERRLPIGDAVEWSFSNGARVVFKSSDNGLGRFRLMGVSEGGLSLVKDADIPSANAVEALAFASGVYKTDRSAMIELMQNHDMDITFQLQNRREMIRGEAMATDADRFFELLYLGITHPRFDEAEFARYVNELKISLDTRRPSELDKVLDSVRMVYSKPSPRTPEVDADYLTRIDAARVEAIFRERFTNPAEFVFYLAGDLTEEQARVYAMKYIGTLPTVKGRRERVATLPAQTDTASVKREFIAAMPDDKAIVDLGFSNNHILSRADALAFWLVGVVLNSRMTDEIRERLGGSYNVTVVSRYNENSEPHQWLTVHFETGSAKVEQMKAAAYKEIDDLLRDGITAQDVESITSAQKQRLAAQPRNTDFWINALFSYIEKGEDQTRPDYHTAVLDAVTPADAMRVARDFWEGVRRFDIVIKAPQNENKTDK